MTSCNDNPVTFPVQKDKARAYAKSRRDAIEPAQREARSRAICTHLIEKLDGYLNANRKGERPLVATFHPFGSEVSLDVLFSKANELGWELCFPCMIGEDGAKRARMEFFLVPKRDEGSGAPAPFDFIVKPWIVKTVGDVIKDGCTLIQPDSLDAMVVPLVAFDKSGNRLGYGGGNYDEYLSRLSPEIPLVGVAFNEQEIPHVPIERHDRKLTGIVKG